MHEENFKVRYYEMDQNGEVPLWILQNYFQEAAGIDAHNLSFGWEELSTSGIAWILTKMQFKFFKKVKNAQTIKVKTWHHICEKIQSRRDFIIYDELGDEVCKGISWWLILDLDKRKIMRAPKELIALNGTMPPPVMEAHILKNPDFSGQNPLNTVQVTARLEDIDYNSHVNNAHFPAWALAGVPREVYQNKRLGDVFINFKTEVLLGDKININTYIQNGGAYWHILTRENDGKEIASVYTSWI
jgi:acyl-ACP thioesterase